MKPALDRAALVAQLPAAGRDAARVVRAPGRVNLIGEHTDYNDGWVLPMAIGLEIWIASSPSDDERVALKRMKQSGELGFLLSNPGPPTGSWIDYVAGVAMELRSTGAPLRAVRGVIASTLPEGSGLSSSAAIELAAAWTLSSVLPPVLPPMDLARIAQRAENVYVGVPCGIMDQAVIALAKAGNAMLLDCRSLEWRHVPLSLPGHRIVVIDSGSRRRLSASAYDQRRSECAEAVAAVVRHEPGVRSLRDVDEATLERLRDAIPATALRRARHVVRENERVLAAVAALQRGDVEAVGQLFSESHASLRDLYEVSSPELETLVGVAGSVPGVLGVRLTGAGFGGCVVALVTEEALAALNQALHDAYRRRTGLTARLHLAEPVAGVGVVSQ